MTIWEHINGIRNQTNNNDIQELQIWDIVNNYHSGIKMRICERNGFRGYGKSTNLAFYNSSVIEWVSDDDEVQELKERLMEKSKVGSMSEITEDSQAMEI